MKLCAEQKTPQHSARSIWELQIFVMTGVYVVNPPP